MNKTIFLCLLGYCCIITSTASQNDDESFEEINVHTLYQRILLTNMTNKLLNFIHNNEATIYKIQIEKFNDLDAFLRNTTKYMGVRVSDMRGLTDCTRNLVYDAIDDYDHARLVTITCYTEVLDYIRSGYYLMKEIYELSLKSYDIIRGQCKITEFLENSASCFHLYTKTINIEEKLNDLNVWIISMMSNVRNEEGLKNCSIEIEKIKADITSTIDKKFLSCVRIVL